jgi:RHS repeat-associated protein
MKNYISDSSYINHLLAKFNTHELDQTGLSYFNARYYDSDTGRFISPDPTVPDPSNTQMFNRYMFVGGNPISFVDMDGYRLDESGTGSIPDEVTEQEKEYYDQVRDRQEQAAEDVRNDPNIDLSQSSEDNPKWNDENNNTSASSPDDYDYADRFHIIGLWVEGAAELGPITEPMPHISLGIGDPYDPNNETYSFQLVGSTWKHWLEGEVYRDNIGPGEIENDRFRILSRNEFEEIKGNLESQVGNKSTYSPVNNCITWTNNQYSEFLRQGYGGRIEPPDRNTSKPTVIGLISNSNLSMTTHTIYETSKQGMNK